MTSVPNCINIGRSGALQGSFFRAVPRWLLASTLLILQSTTSEAQAEADLDQRHVLEPTHAEQEASRPTARAPRRHGCCWRTHLNPSQEGCTSSASMVPTRARGRFFKTGSSRTTPPSRTAHASPVVMRAALPSKVREPAVILAILYERSVYSARPDSYIHRSRRLSCSGVSLLSRVHLLKTKSTISTPLNCFSGFQHLGDTPQTFARAYVHTSAVRRHCPILTADVSFPLLRRRFRTMTRPTRSKYLSSCKVWRVCFFTQWRLPFSNSPPRKHTTKTTAMASTCTGLRRVPPCAPPPELIAAMVDAGAHMEEVEGGEEGDDRPLCVLRIDKVESKAWKLYQDWTELLGDVDPLVQAVFAPSTALVGTPLCPPLTLVGGILNEANSIINQLAPLSTEDSGKGEDVLTGPLQAPVMMVNVDRASVSTTVVLPVIANPGDKYPVIHAMPYGQYICTIQYVWTGVFISVGMYRSNATVLA